MGTTSGKNHPPAIPEVRQIADLPYLPPYGLPVSHQNEATGTMRAAFIAFLESKGNMERAQFNLVKDYLLYHIKAPIWKEFNKEEDIERLVALAKNIKTVKDMEEYLYEANTIGLDPI